MGSFLQGFFDFLISLQKAKEKMPQKIQPVFTKKPCPICGLGLQELIEKSRLGCSFCYEHYREELVPSLHQIHNAVRHTGKVCKNKLSDLEFMPSVEQILLLKKQLNKAIADEKYEQADMLNKKIIALESPQ